MNKFHFTILFVGLIVLGHTISVQAAPQFLVSWQAQNYAPGWYQGKILPINGTPVNVSFELIDGGKVVNLSNTIVRWYVNDKLALNEKNGLGIKKLKTNVSSYNGGDAEIRIAVLDYKGGGMIDKIVKIPVVSPEAVINAPYPDREIKIGSSAFGLIPFFFNVRDIGDLSVDWSVNGQKPTALNNPFVFGLNIGSETPINTQIDISVSVKNILKDLEFASQNIHLLVK